MPTGTTARSNPSPSSARAISRVPYLPGLDGMRAVAVVAVMIYHANSSWLQGGFIGVEVFFVISGYLITLLLIAEHERTGTVDMKNFWIRRFRRLLPALFLMMTLLAIWTALFERAALGQLRGDILGGLAYISNWYQIFIGAGYSAANDFAPLRHLWSLAVEEQFYLVWPIVMVALLRKGSRRIADLSVWLFGGAVFVAIVVAVLYHSGPIAPLVTDQATGVTSTSTPEAYWNFGGRLISKGDALYLSTISRASGLLLGAAFAMVWRPVAVMRGPLASKGRMLDGLAVVGFAILALMSWKVGFINTTGDNSADPWLFRGGFFVSGIATLMIIAAVTHSTAWTSRALSTPTMLWLGTRSYGLYLYHWPIYQIVRNTAGNKLAFHEWVLCMVATAIITEISYRYVETPIRKGSLSALWRRPTRARQQNRGAVLGGAVVGTALAVFAGASLATAELKQNEVAEDLRQGQASVCNLLTEDCSTPDDAAAEPVDDPVTDAFEQNPDQVEAGDPSEQPADVAEPVGDDAIIVPESTEPPPPPAELVAIGDSVMLGAAEELSAAGFVVDAQESRSFGNGSALVQALADSNRLPTKLVVHLGTNGPIRSSELDTMMGLIGPVERVLLVLNDVDRDYTADNNSLLINAASANSNVDVLYWDGLASQCQGDCLYQDGIHLKSTGAAYYTQLIVNVLNA